MWNNFVEKNPKLANFIEQFIKFYLISMVVTVLQYLMLTFLPSIISNMTDLDTVECAILPIFSTGKYIFDYTIEEGGMAYFAAYGITLFVAQCINFPMQRNITFKSKGNIYYQIMWYAIAFFAIFIVCSGLQTFYQPILESYIGSPYIYNILITVINGGVQMVIYFPIYKIIFPEGNK